MFSIALRRVGLVLVALALCAGTASAQTRSVREVQLNDIRTIEGEIRRAGQRVPGVPLRLAPHGGRALGEASR